MNETKPWYLSRTIWASVVTVVAGMGGLLGLPVEEVDNQALVETLLQAVTAISGLLAIFGRLAADRRIN
ncbi:hypothetical protein [Chelativorans salis]|uniref:Holin n=1 Tax=Chelativorans salis TaxID=2978478 RepID=A0ABT2LNB1_9HYPH|nr:hypothetical protein [Chelativorans sp. EGI FJ00035]MCT7376057.1 hypothetical protein [Chelativorans sp. EGI FJ00035]